MAMAQLMGGASLAAATLFGANVERVTGAELAPLASDGVVYHSNFSDPLGAEWTLNGTANRSNSVALNGDYSLRTGEETAGTHSASLALGDARLQLDDEFTYVTEFYFHVAQFPDSVVNALYAPGNRRDISLFLDTRSSTGTDGTADAGVDLIVGTGDTTTWHANLIQIGQWYHATIHKDGRDILNFHLAHTNHSLDPADHEALLDLQGLTPRSDFMPTQMAFGAGNTTQAEVVHIDRLSIGNPVHPVPEPASAAVLMGAAALAALRPRRRRSVAAAALD